MQVSITCYTITWRLHSCYIHQRLIMSCATNISTIPFKPIIYANVHLCPNDDLICIIIINEITYLQQSLVVLFQHSNIVIFFLYKSLVIYWCDQGNLSQVIVDLNVLNCLHHKCHRREVQVWISKTSGVRFKPQNPHHSNVGMILASNFKGA